MTLQTTTHLNFRGDARAALTFYHSVFGGHVEITTYTDAGMPPDAPAAQNVMFGRVEADSGFRVMAYDVPGESAGSLAGGGSTRRENQLTLTDQDAFVSLASERFDELAAVWERLREEALVIQPFEASAWSAGFGMLTDRFGVTWTLSVATSS